MKGANENNHRDRSRSFQATLGTKDGLHWSSEPRELDDAIELATDRSAAIEGQRRNAPAKPPRSRPDHRRVPPSTGLGGGDVASSGNVPLGRARN